MCVRSEENNFSVISYSVLKQFSKYIRICHTFVLIFVFDRNVCYHLGLIFTVDFTVGGPEFWRDTVLGVLNTAIS